MVQLNFNLINMCAPCTRHDTLFISLVEMHDCACQIDDIEAHEHAQVSYHIYPYRSLGIYLLYMIFEPSLK